MFVNRLSLPALTVAFAGLTAGPAHAASMLVLNFDTDASGNAIQHGQIIDDEYAAWGVTVAAKHPRTSRLDLAVAQNTGLASEGDHNDPASGLGNVLIVSSKRADHNNDGLIDDPRSPGWRPGGQFTFTFDAARRGGELTVLDAEVEENTGTIQLWLDGILNDTIAIAGLGNKSVQTLGFGDALFNRVVVQLAGSGGIDNLKVGVVPTPAAVSLGLVALTALVFRRRQAA